MEVRFCPRCGASRLPGAMFCGACGLGFGSIAEGTPDAVAPVRSPPAEPSSPPAEPPSPPAALRVVTPVPPALGRLSATASLDRVRNRRRAVNGFVRGGAVLVAAGVLLPLLGAPQPAAGLAPIGSVTETIQLLDYAPLVVVAVLVAIALASVAAWTRDAADVGPALAMTGAAGIGVIVLAIVAAGRLGYDAAGQVLPAVSLVVAGGASLLAAALVGALVRE